MENMPVQTLPLAIENKQQPLRHWIIPGPRTSPGRALCDVDPAFGVQAESVDLTDTNCAVVPQQAWVNGVMPSGRGINSV